MEGWLNEKTLASVSPTVKSPTLTEVSAVVDQN
jgi:hypothetical protein